MNQHSIIFELKYYGKLDSDITQGDPGYNIDDFVYCPALSINTVKLHNNDFLKMSGFKINKI